MHHTKDKGDIAAAMALADLTLKGYICFTPTVSEHLPFDLIAYKDGRCLRIQAKYCSSGTISNKTSWADKNGNHKKYYNQNDFDYYALYSPSLNKVLYPSISFGGKTIAYNLPNSGFPFYWWEDFLDFTDDAAKKTNKDFGYKIIRQKTKEDSILESSIKRRKVERPSKEELNLLIWSKPMVDIGKDFGVSDKAIAKWIKFYGLEKPPNGHWIRENYQKNKAINTSETNT
jgi:hypothetical protein